MLESACTHAEQSNCFSWAMRNYFFMWCEVIGLQLRNDPAAGCVMHAAFGLIRVSWNLVHPARNVPSNTNHWVWMSNTMGFVSSQWKHTLWDGKSLAGYFSCCGQRFPWQVSLNHTFVCTCSFRLSLYLLLINFSFPEDMDWSPMTKSWLKINTKPCELKLHT